MPGVLLSNRMQRRLRSMTTAAKQVASATVATETVTTKTKTKTKTKIKIKTTTKNAQKRKLSGVNETDGNGVKKEDLVDEIKVDEAIVVKKKAKSSPAGKKVIHRSYLVDHIGPLEYFSRSESLNNPTERVLPVEFYDMHTPEFVKGLEFILAKDPSLFESISHAVFKNRFLKSHAQDVHLNKLKRSGLFYFNKLVDSFISQQISGKAAESIKRRMIEEISPDGKTMPLPQKFLNCSIEELRHCGLSQQKAKYIKTISLAFIPEPYDKIKEEIITRPELRREIDEIIDGYPGMSKEAIKTVKLDYERFNGIEDSQTNQEIDSTLQQFKGIGPWSASMFLMFALNKFDIFENRDLGIKRGASVYLKARPELLLEIDKVIKREGIAKSVKADKYVNDEVLDVLSAQFKPYRTIMMLILWRLSDISIDVLES